MKTNRRISVSRRPSGDAFPAFSSAAGARASNIPQLDIIFSRAASATASHLSTSRLRQQRRDYSLSPGQRNFKGQWVRVMVPWPWVPSLLQSRPSKTKTSANNNIFGSFIQVTVVMNLTIGYNDWIFDTKRR